MPRRKKARRKSRFADIGFDCVGGECSGLGRKRGAKRGRRSLFPGFSDISNSLATTGAPRFISRFKKGKVGVKAYTRRYPRRLGDVAMGAPAIMGSAKAIFSKVGAKTFAGGFVGGFFSDLLYPVGRKYIPAMVPDLGVSFLTSTVSAVLGMELTTRVLKQRDMAEAAMVGGFFDLYARLIPYGTNPIKGLLFPVPKTAAGLAHIRTSEKRSLADGLSHVRFKETPAGLNADGSFMTAKGESMFA